MNDYQLRHLPAKYHALFKQSREYLQNGDIEQAALTFDKLPESLEGIADVEYLKRDIARALGVEEQLGIRDEARSAVEISTVQHGASENALLFHAKSPLEMGMAPEDSTPEFASPVDVSMRRPAQAQVATPAAVAESGFERFHNGFEAARRNDNAKMEALAAAPVRLAPAMSVVEQTGEAFSDPQAYANDFAERLEAAREQNYQAQPWSDAAPYEPPTQEQPQPAQPTCKPGSWQAWSAKMQASVA